MLGNSGQNLVGKHQVFQGFAFVYCFCFRSCCCFFLALLFPRELGVTRSRLIVVLVV